MSRTWSRPTPQEGIPPRSLLVRPMLLSDLELGPTEPDSKGPLLSPSWVVSKLFLISLGHKISPVSRGYTVGIIPDSLSLAHNQGWARTPPHWVKYSAICWHLEHAYPPPSFGRSHYESRSHLGLWGNHIRGGRGWGTSWAFHLPCDYLRSFHSFFSFKFVYLFLYLNRKEWGVLGFWGDRKSVV
jgi:hypothetical protein